MALEWQAFGQVVTEAGVGESVRKRVAVTVAHLQATQGPQVCIVDLVIFHHTVNLFMFQHQLIQASASTVHAR